MFLTSPTKAGKPTPEMPNCSVIRHSWVSQAGMRVINYKWHAVLPQRLVAYVTQSVSYQTQSSKFLFITGYVWAVNPVRTSEGICHCAPPGRKTREWGRGDWAALNRGHALQVRRLERFQVPPFTALSTQDKEELNKFSSTGVCQTPRRPWGREHKKTKICAWEDNELVSEEEACTREKRDDHELLK